MGIRNSPEDNELLTIFAIGQISMFCHSLTNRDGIGSASHKAFEDTFNSCLISITGGSKVSIMEVHDSSTDEISVYRLENGNPLCIVIIFSWKC